MPMGNEREEGRTEKRGGGETKERGEEGREGGRAGTSGTQHKALSYVALLDGDVAPGFMMY